MTGELEWRCVECGSAGVTANGACSWDPGLQLWVAAEDCCADVGAWCAGCEGEADVALHPHRPPPGRGQAEELPLGRPPRGPRRDFACSACGGGKIVVAMESSWSPALGLWVGSGEPDAGENECFCFDCDADGRFDERERGRSEDGMLEETVE